MKHVSVMCQGGVYYSHDTHCPDDFRHTFQCLTYRWFHLPTGKQGKRKIWCRNQDELRQLLDRWNNHPDWVYATEAR